MNCYSAVGCFADVQETIHNQIAGCTAISEKQVSVLESAARKTSSVVDPLIQPDDGRHVVFAEVVEIGLGGMLSWHGKDNIVNKVRRRM